MSVLPSLEFLTDNNVPEDLEDLVNLGIARKQRLARAHLGEDASHRPHVNSGRVLAATGQDFGCAVPESDNLVGVGAKRDTKGARETKVGQLQVALAVNQQVLRLEIAVQDPMAVAVAHA